MDKAVLVIAHKAPEQINLLIEQLLADARGRTDIYLHVDKKAEAICDRITKNERVFFIRNNISVTWGDDSNVRCLLGCFREILDSGREYDYFVITTGQDLMIRPGLDAFLEENKGRIYIEIGKNDKYIKNLLLHKTPRFLCRDLGRGFLYWVRIGYTVLARTGVIPRKKIDYDVDSVDFYTSYNWSLMPWETLRHIMRFLDENPAFLDLYWDTTVPEDGFLGTLIMNSPYRDRVVYKPDGKKGESLTFHPPMDGPHMVTLTNEHRAGIDASGCFFARKFDMKVCPEIVEYYHRKVVPAK